MLASVRRFAAALLMIAAAGCDQANPIGPSVQVNDAFVLAPDETATILSTPIRIRFVRVFGDSRCPADVVCIQGGDAIVRIEVLSFGAGARQYELHTGSLAPVTHDAFTITLVQLAPYPFSSRTIQQSEYRATLRVSR